mmetsp:Transcript_23665/g.45041  ORF Transcript_23665/g.45041 Transcript_23665/m.45041 type:complete len:82 (-) Transcript_23665:744-989(-)
MGSFAEDKDCVEGLVISWCHSFVIPHRIVLSLVIRHPRLTLFSPGTYYLGDSIQYQVHTFDGLSHTIANRPAIRVCDSSFE